MSRFHSYINTAEKIINEYKGEQPFSVFIKIFFSKDKRYGANDRKQISTICYHYFRVGNALTKYHTQDKMIAAAFLCNNTSTELLEKIKPAWNEIVNLSVTKKMQLINNHFTLTDLFSFTNELSAEIEVEKFCTSFLIQPQLFVRIRKLGNVELILQKLTNAAIDYKLLNQNCLQLATGSNIETILAIDKDVVVQDYSSQQVLNFFIENSSLFPSKPSIWDCCAASGGKSILLYDILQGKCNITVSDVRPAILSNLHQRFKKASINYYKYFIADIANPAEPLPATIYDVIVCDAPCTGSGTWSRTPEQLYYFNADAVTIYTKLQKKIIENAIPHLAKGGIFVYITCSVFAKENETIASFIQEKFNLQLLQQNNLAGYYYKADSMFVAIFKN